MVCISPPPPVHPSNQPSTPPPLQKTHTQSEQAKGNPLAQMIVGVKLEQNLMVSGERGAVEEEQAVFPFFLIVVVLMDRNEMKIDAVDLSFLES